MKRLAILVTVVTLLVLALPTPAAAATRYTVDDDWQIGVAPYVEDTDGDTDFATIGAAVNAANSGDTISVVPGTYTEKIIVDTWKSDLTIQSTAGSAVTIIRQADLDAVTINGNSNTFQGFTIKDETAFDTHPHPHRLIRIAGNGNIIRDNILTGRGPGLKSDDLVAVRGDLRFNAIASGNVIENNEVLNSSGMGIRVGGIFLAQAQGTRVCNNNVHDNVVGISVDSAPDTLVMSNTVHTNTTGIHVEARAGRPVRWTYIRYNVVQNNMTGMRFRGADGVWDATNTITGNNIGIQVVVPEPGASGTPIITSDNIYGNTTYGVENETDETLSAESNWWGHASGPSGPDGRKNPAGQTIGKGDAVKGNVDWDPWLPQPVGHTPHPSVPPGLPR